jgi:uncharacterized protein
VRLSGSRCSRCGLVAFPAEPYGCERCGAHGDELVAAGLSAAGRVRCFATVHRHHNPDLEAPFTVVEVVLDDGPALKAVWLGDGIEPAIGDRAEGAMWEDRFVFVPKEG